MALLLSIAIANSQYENLEHLIRDADTALLRAKQISGCFDQVFDEAMHCRAISLLEIETDLKSAIHNQELLVYYQPIVELKTGKISELEALIPWKDPRKGFISPSDFIPIAEETGMIIDLGLWVFKEVCQQLYKWQLPITVSVNLSARQLEQPDFVEQIDEILNLTRVKSKYIKFELTESILTENDEVARKILLQLKLQKIGLSINDFGTGYSCLSYLHQFPIDTLKIDRAFVNREDMEIAKTIIGLAHNLGMNVVAEGVETEQQRSRLQELYCEYGQGYLFSKPVNSQEIETLLKTES